MKMTKKSQDEHAQYIIDEVRPLIANLAHMSKLAPELRVFTLRTISRYADAWASIVATENVGKVQEPK